MKIKTSIAVLTGCLTIFLFLMLPVFLSMKEQKDQSVAAFKGSDFELKDMNNNTITQESFNGPLKDLSVIISLLTSIRENSEPLNFASTSSFFFSIDKKIGSIINRKINKQPVIIAIEVFNFIVVK